MDRPTFTFTVPSSAAGQRLDRYLHEQIPDVSREKIKKAIQNGNCYVQNTSVTANNTRLLPGQLIQLYMQMNEASLIPEQGDVEIVWQDTDIIIVNKSAGLTVHPCPSCPQGTLIQRIATHYPQLLQQEGLRPGIVHRLDKDTSGLMIVALSERARLRLTEMFAAHEVHKEYLALVQGVPPEEGCVADPVGRHPQAKVKMAVVPENKGGKPAKSQWTVLWADVHKRFALVRVQIFTGRTHQIRVHMAHAGYPLWGDSLYGSQHRTAGYPHIPRQMLHAWRLRFTHPITAEPLQFTCPPPADMQTAALQLAHLPWRVVLTGLPGCGKSSLLYQCKTLGMPIWSADAVVDKLYDVNGQAWHFLRHRFDDRFVRDATQAVDRKALRNAMEQDHFLRQEVEAAVHALVQQDLHSFWAQCAADGTVGVAEIPLYFESGWHKNEPNTLTVGIDCPATIRHQRLMQNRSWTPEQCRLIDSWQWPEEKKLGACQYVVSNSSDPAALEQCAQNILHEILIRTAAYNQGLQCTWEQLWC